MQELSSYILLSTQLALSTHVSTQLRAVTIDFDKRKNRLLLHFFYDGEISDELFDLASCASVEIETGFFEYEVNSDFASRLDYPNQIPIEGRLVYLRYEPIQTIYHQKSSLEYVENELPMTQKVQLAMQDALLGKVTPELRRITFGIDSNAKKMDLFFYYDGKISLLHSELAKSTSQHIKPIFSEYTINEHLIRVDLPKKISPLGTASVYHRAETYDLID